MSRKRYYVDTSLGGCRMYAETIEGAKQVADDNAMCLQRDIYITEARGRTVAIRRWVAREYDPAIDDDKDPRSTHTKLRSRQYRTNALSKYPARTFFTRPT